MASEVKTTYLWSLQTYLVILGTVHTNASNTFECPF